MRALQVLTNSAEKKWRQCQRLYRYEMIDLIRPLVDGDALVFGDWLHRGLEAWWRAAQAAGECTSCEGSGESMPYVAQFPGGEPQTDPCVACDGSGRCSAPVCADCNGMGRVDQTSGEPDAMGDPCGPCQGSGRDRSGWLRAALSAVRSDSDQWRRATIEALLAGYHERWQSMTWGGQPIEVLAVEHEFRAPLLNPDTGSASKTWERGGKLDVLVRVAGAVWVIEHKSTSEDFSPGSPYRQRLRLDTQVSGYHVGAKSLGVGDVAGVIYDVIGKPGLKPLKATPVDKRKYTKATKNEPSRLYAGQRETDETVDEYQERVVDELSKGDYFARFEVLRLRHEEEAAARDTWEHAQAIRDAMRLGRFPRNPSACSQYGRTCCFMPICLGEATERDGTRYRKAETAHEELSAERKAA